MLTIMEHMKRINQEMDKATCYRNFAVNSNAVNKFITELRDEKR